MLPESIIANTAITVLKVIIRNLLSPLDPSPSSSHTQLLVAKNVAQPERWRVQWL
jgi:hypothetical protein